MMSKTLILKKLLSKIETGTLEVTFPNGQTQRYGNGNTPKAKVIIKNNKAISAMISEGDIGFGRGYIEEWWVCDDLLAVLDILSANIELIENYIYGNKFFNAIYKIYDFFKKNTLANSKKNIEYHYDLGNNFYFKWLDETKSYSSALFKDNEDLVTAQKNKYQNILKYIPESAEDILEVGCGWGGFMQEAINKNPQVKIKGLTLSNEQFAYVKEKFANNPNINPYIQDYRNESGIYDAIVSIEMFEAVGREYWDTYMKQLYKCLKNSGVAVVQTITIENKSFDKYISTSDFIRHFIFPGGLLPTKEIFTDLAVGNGFEVVACENFGDSYRKTLIHWLEDFNKQDIISLGFSGKFIRKWQLYLAYCAAAFGVKRIDVYQFVLKKNA